MARLLTLKGLSVKTVLSLGLNVTISCIALMILLTGAFSTRHRNEKAGFGIDFRRVTTFICMNLAILDIATYTLALVGVNPRSFLQVVLPLSALFWVVSLKSHYKKIFIFAPAILLAIAIAVWELLPSLAVSASSGVPLGMASVGNNDVAAYAVSANEFLKSGFSNSNHFVSNDMNNWTKTSAYFTPNTVISFVASIFHLRAWQVMIPVMILAVTFAILSLARLASSFFPKMSKLTAIIIGGVCMLIPLTDYMVANYFLGQVFSIGVGAIILASLTEVYRDNRLSTLQTIEIVSVTVLGVFTYPPFLIPFFIVSFCWGVGISSILQKKFNVALILKMSLAILAGELLSLPYLKTALGLMLGGMNAGGGGGWHLPFLTPQAIFVWPRWIGSSQPFSFVMFLWSVFYLGAFIFIYRSNIDTVRKREVGLLFLLGNIGLVAILYLRHMGRDNYQTWKLISYMVPIFILLLLVVLVSGFRFGHLVLAIVVTVASMAPIAQWWNTLHGGSGLVSSDMAMLESRHMTKKYVELNIDVKPWGETMAFAAVVNDSRIHLVAQSYFASSENPNDCTLVRNDDSRYTNVRRVNGTYGIAPSKSGNCR
jgi:hypothetical protein